METCSSLIGGNRLTPCCEHIGEVSKFLVDEGQQYSEDMVVYLMSRMRNPASKCKPHMKITCNPDKNSYLRQWVDWYLLPNGLPDPEKACKLRYFLRLDNKMNWGDSPQELLEKYGRRDENGELYPLGHKKQLQPLSFKFIPATVYDNPVLMDIQPEYVAWLEGLGRVEKERLLFGNWDATAESAGYFKKEWVQKVPLPPIATVKKVRAWDISGTLPSDQNPNPDYTAGVKISKDKFGHYCIEDVVRDRRRHGGVLDLILETAQHDGQDTMILVPCDPGAAGKAYAASLVRALADAGYYARMKQTNQSKVTRFAPFAATAEAGNVSYVVAEWNEMYFQELEGFDGSRKVKDDMVDATSDAFTALAQNINIPTFELPDFTQTNNFSMS